MTVCMFVNGSNFESDLDNPLPFIIRKNEVGCITSIGSMVYGNLVCRLEMDCTSRKEDPHLQWNAYFLQGVRCSKNNDLLPDVIGHRVCSFSGVVPNAHVLRDIATNAMVPSGVQFLQMNR